MLVRNLSRNEINTKLKLWIQALIKLNVKLLYKKTLVAQN